MSQKSVDVIIPSLNIDEWLYKSVENIANDKFTARIIVLFDKGEIDLNYLDRLATFKKVEIVENKVKGSVSSALNLGLSMSSSRFVARMDADDISLNGRFGNQIKSIENSGACATFSNIVAINSYDKKIPNPRPYLPTGFIWQPLLLLGNPLYHPTMLCKRSWIENLNGYRDTPAEDYDLWLRAEPKDLFIESKPILAYRFHKNQVSKRLNARKILDLSWENYKSIWNSYLPENAILSEHIFKLSIDCLDNTMSSSVDNSEIIRIYNILRHVYSRTSVGIEFNAYKPYIINRLVKLIYNNGIRAADLLLLKDVQKEYLIEILRTLKFRARIK